MKGQSGVMAPASNEADQKLPRLALMALVIGSMVGSGIFALPASFGRATGALEQLSPGSLRA
jgi:arginine:ornithine antiporter/lysine permease